MNVKIEDNLFLESDEHNFILRQSSEKGNDRLKFFQSLEGVAHSLFARKIKRSTASNLNQLLDEINEIKKMVRERLDAS